MILALLACGGFLGAREKHDHKYFASKLRKLLLNEEQLGKFLPQGPSDRQVQYRFCPYKLPKSMHDTLVVMEPDP